VLGREIRDILGDRLPRDHARQTLADSYAARLRPRDVLDLGCGAGDSVELFRQLDSGVRWVGVDIEDSTEVRARSRTDAEFHTFDGVHLPFEDSSFNLVYSKQVLEHVVEPAPLIREVTRVLRPGGHFAGSTSQLEPFHSRSTANYTPYGLAVLLEGYGLEVVELRPGIDALALIVRRGLGRPRWMHRWWVGESPLNRAIDLVGRLGRRDAAEVNALKLLFCGQFAFLARRPAGTGVAETAPERPEG
jgi:SAM-dependent methyltransferase